MPVYPMEKRVFLKQTTCPVFNHLSEQLLSEKHWKKQSFTYPNFLSIVGTAVYLIHNMALCGHHFFVLFYNVEYVSG